MSETEGDYDMRNRNQFIAAVAFLSAALFSQPSSANKVMLPTQFNLSFMASQIHVASSGNLKYYGGPVISNAKIYTVYWGSNINSQVKSEIGTFYKTLISSDHMDWINEYATNIAAVDGRAGTNQSIGRGTYGGEYMITPKNTSNSVDDKEIQAEIEAQILAKKLPAPDANSLYMVHFPAGVTINMDGSASCQAFCAYHEGFASAKVGNVFYGVMPDLSSGMCSFGCGFAGSPFDSTTIVASHEVTEAITDPFPTPGSNPAFPQAWNTTDGNEIGDLCASSTASVVGAKTYAIQGEYDNSISACKTGTYKAPLK
jgi:hypothetical protein